MKQRIITGGLGGIGFLAVLLLGGGWFATLICLLAVIGFFELLRMAGINYTSIPALLGYAILLLILTSSFIEGSALFLEQYDTSLWLGFTMLLLVITVLMKNHFSVEQAGILLLGIIYIGYGFFYFIQTRLEYGLPWVIFIILVIWSTDSGAYFVGRSWGKRKLWPSISPNKTVEGFIGGIVIALLAGVIFQWITGLLESLTTLFFITLVVSIIGQLGDLVESAIKRHFEVKDSGTLLPGHGGVLDRFDSMLFVFPVLYILQILT